VRAITQAGPPCIEGIYGRNGKGAKAESFALLYAAPPTKIVTNGTRRYGRSLLRDVFNWIRDDTTF